MTEAEIMKEFDELLKAAGENPLGIKFQYGFSREFVENVVDLLNRKNAECKECGRRTSESIEKLQKQLAEKNAEIEKANKEKDNLIETYIQVCNSWNNTTIELQATRNEVMKMKVAIKTERAEAIKEFFESIDSRCIDTFGNFNHKAFITLRKEMGVEL